MKTKVLICGAGPTGLMMACQLKRFGVDCIVVDTKEGPVKESRALAVQARTLQIYEQMGIAETALQQGNIADRANVIIKQKKVQQISFKSLGKGLSAYPFFFILEQNKNEEILYEHLKASGGDVMWKHSLLNFTQNEDEVTAFIKDENGEEDNIIVDWLIGADGAKSIVRHILQSPFTGDTYENIFYVADTAMKWPWGHEGLSICLSSHTFMAVFPMPGDNRYRLIGILPKQFKQEDVKDFSQIQNTIEQQNGLQLSFTNTNWFSLYKLHHRCVDNFRMKKVFLAGDAAHVHSPVGGQGMNTGLQDAYNLAWKLALVINKQADEKLLNSYNEERLPIAKRLVNTTDKGFSLMTSPKWHIKIFRLYIFPVLIKYILRSKKLRVFIFRTASQIAINYKKSSLSVSENKNLLQAGCLIPFVNINSKVIDEHLKFNGFTILLFDTILSDEQKQGIQNSFLVRFQFIDIRRDEKNEDAFNKFKVKISAMFLIRPDNYIGFASESISISDIKKYLSETINLIAKPV
ncbi:MAG: FAD-dependent monooxygenase [Bacteroidota bacterium]|nr:FAD-dependent monooxygenase [Bacteroidota bacterium]